MKYQKEDLAYFPYQIEYAVNNYQPHPYEASNFSNVVIGGLGGSGIAGRIVKRIFLDKANLPIEVVSNYHLPYYVNERSLVILSSYSGNTEETLSLYEEAKLKGACIIVISTGGELGQMAQNEGWYYYQSEDGFQPRMALGYSLTYLLLILGDLFGCPMGDEMRSLSNKFRDTESFIETAEQYFKIFKTKASSKFIAITDVYTAPIGLRFCQQIQENAKNEAFVHEIPEANHNVIESYYGDMDSVFFFLNTAVAERINLRFQFLENLLENYGNQLVHIPVKNNSLHALLNAGYILDWIALLVADQKDIKSLEIPNIKNLKEALKQGIA